ncbi:MAG: Fis family transcriptional regulator [Planctomycetota bacterium]|nr:MAG: Fis family transcriptional regulator [Planctomycetota bacterium]
MVNKSIDKGSLEIFQYASKIVFANPFSSQRFELDKKITRKAKTPRDNLEYLNEVIEEVSHQVDKIDKKNQTKLLDFSVHDQKVMKWVYLFDVYHRHLKDFDDLIVDQIQNGEDSVKVLFYKDFTGGLLKRGLSKKESFRYLSIAYQIRRAFYFIKNRLIGVSPCMQELRSSLWNNIFTHNLNFYEQHLWNRMEDFSTLLLGETGTGKGAVASAIGWSGYVPFNEKNESFEYSFLENYQAINLSQYVENLLESELFGHQKGAFTGAISGHVGVLSKCNKHGTIFLDEIGDIAVSVQIKLLKVLQERTFTTVGGFEPKRFSGRVVAATNRPLASMCERGEFREDFYYRLCSDIILVPTLNRRIKENNEELDIMISHVLKTMTGIDSSDKTNSVKEIIVRDLGVDYSWPGNVRELEQCIRSIIVKGSCQPNMISSQGSKNITEQFDQGDLSCAELIAQYCYHLYQKHNSYESVAKITGLDRRTVKKHVQNHK